MCEIKTIQPDSSPSRRKSLMYIIAIPSPKSGEKRAVEYHAYFTDQGEKRGGSTAHGRYNNRFAVFKPMCR
jgi:hypothetical protein